MKKKTAYDLTRTLFQLSKRFPRPMVKPDAAGGLTRSEYDLLGILRLSGAEAKTALSVTELSNRLLITPAGVTHQINSLEELGYVERLPDPRDRRIVLVSLTARGTQAADALLAEIQGSLAGLVRHLGEDDSQAFIRLMSRANDYFAGQPEAAGSSRD